MTSNMILPKLGATRDPIWDRRQEFAVESLPETVGLTSSDSNSKRPTGGPGRWWARERPRPKCRCSVLAEEATRRTQSGIERGTVARL